MYTLLLELEISLLFLFGHNNPGSWSLISMISKGIMKNNFLIENLLKTSGKKKKDFPVTLGWSPIS